MGTDQFGNKYFEITEGVQYGRHRFVVYANIHNYSPLSVPPEWHGWLHDINNANPTKVKMSSRRTRSRQRRTRHSGTNPRDPTARRASATARKSWCGRRARDVARPH